MIDKYKKYEPLFGNWLIRQSIGKGSYGEVFLIEKHNFNEVYQAALKAITIPGSDGEVEEMRASGMSDQEIKDSLEEKVAELLREFSIMASLKGNTNIVSYEDHQVIPRTNGLGWDILMKMELVIPLQKYIAVHTITQDELIKMGIDICKGLELCEKRNIVHRDIKPENIFISPNGDYKLGDFGTAAVVEPGAIHLAKNGTFAYMAPEMYKEEKFNLTQDLYALGMVMYKFLNHNRLPFMPKYPQPLKINDKDIALLNRMRGNSMATPSCDGNAKLVQVVLKACSYDPANRYQSAATMKEDLLACLEQGNNDNVLLVGKALVDHTETSQKQKAVSNVELSHKEPVKIDSLEKTDKGMHDTVKDDRELSLYERSLLEETDGMSLYERSLLEEKLQQRNRQNAAMDIPTPTNSPMDIIGSVQEEEHDYEKTEILDVAEKLKVEAQLQELQQSTMPQPKVSSEFGGQLDASESLNLGSHIKPSIKSDLGKQLDGDELLHLGEHITTTVEHSLDNKVEPKSEIKVERKEVSEPKSEINHKPEVRQNWDIKETPSFTSNLGK